VIRGAFVALARPSNCPYLKEEGPAKRAHSSPKPLHRMSRMAQPISPRQKVTVGIGPHRAVSAMTVAAASLGASLFVGALALWFHYGTAVFFEMIASGIAACF
jgi:hypothetical protein